MKKNVKKIIENETKAVYNSNMYIQLRRSFNIIQKRVIHFVVKQLQDEIYNLNEQKHKGRPIERTLFGDCYFHVPTKAIDPLNQDTNIRRALKGLMVPVENSTTIGHFLMKATRLNGEWRLLFNEEAVHFLSEVSKGVTPLGTLVYLSAESIYTVRMYELLMQFRDTGKYYATPEDLCDLLGTPEGYKKDSSRLKQKALNVSQKELKKLYDSKQSEICFTYKEVRGGRGNKLQRLDFSIFFIDKAIKKDSEQSENLRYISTQLERIMITDVSSKEYKKSNQEFINRALSKLIETAQIKSFAGKLEKRVLENSKIPHDKKGAAARWILIDDYGVE